MLSAEANPGGEMYMQTGMLEPKILYFVVCRIYKGMKINRKLIKNTKMGYVTHNLVIVRVVNNDTHLELSLNAIVLQS